MLRRAQYMAYSAAVLILKFLVILTKELCIAILHRVSQIRYLVLLTGQSETEQG